MYESKSHPLIPKKLFFRRVFLHGMGAALLLFGSLISGMAGYEHYEGLAWRDAFLNSAMLLGGMGPVDAPRTDGGKLFAGIYALYSGLVFLVVVALIFAPFVHRIMHRFHWQEDR
jgi:hypothetical protein